MHPYFHITFLILQLGVLSSSKPRSDKDLRSYPIPIPLKPYPVVTKNSYRSDNAWGEIRTASHSADQFRVEIQKEDGSREGISVYKTPDGKIQRQYYEAGANGYRVKRENPFLKSAPRKLNPRSLSDTEMVSKSVSVATAKPGVADFKTVSPEVLATYRMSPGKPEVSPGRLAALKVRQEAFEAGKKLVEPMNKETPADPIQNYESILSAIRPQQNFLDKLFPLQSSPSQVSISRPQSVALAGPSSDSEASTSGTALAGPGSVAVAAPESVAIAGPGGFAFSSATGISSVDTQFDNDNVQISNSLQNTPTVITAPIHAHHGINNKDRPNGRLPKPAGQLFQQQPSTRPRQTGLLPQYMTRRLWSPRNMYSSLRADPTLMFDRPRPNLVFDNGQTVIAHPNSNFATFYHHQPRHRPSYSSSFTFQKHGNPFFYYFQY